MSSKLENVKQLFNKLKINLLTPQLNQVKQIENEVLNTFSYFQASIQEKDAQIAALQEELRLLSRKTNIPISSDETDKTTTRRLLGNVIHEFRAPVNGLAGMIALLNHTEINQEQKNLLEATQEYIAKIKRIFNSLDQNPLFIHLHQLEANHSTTQQQDIKQIKEKLLANISHEFRTPLNAIVGMTHLLQNTTLDDKQQHFLDVTQAAADNLLLLINDLLELSSIRGRSIQLAKKPFSTEKFFTELYSIVWFKARQKNLSLKFNLPKNLPEYLIGDQNRIHQVLMNLLTNATKFTHEGSIELNTKIISKKNSKIYLELAVTDTGIGIAEDKLPHLFESFAQLHDNQEEVYVGMGSGLSIVQHLVHLMNGQMSVKSELGKGTSFMIVIPFDIADNKSIQKHQSQQSHSIEATLKDKKILYIEDNHANIVYMKNILADYPKEFDAAEDFVTAAQLLSHKQYDCILSDVKLPEGSGIDFIANLRSHDKAINRETPVIVITAGATDSERTKAQEIGIEGYISKPFSPDTLFNDLNRIFNEKDDIQSLLAFYPHPKKKKTKENENYLKHLDKVMNGNKKAMIEMIDIFLKQLPDSTRKMEIAVQKRDWKRVHFEAHKVKSTIGIIGLKNLQGDILKINEYTRELKNLHQVPQLFEKFKKQGEFEVKKLTNERKKLSKRKIR